MSLKNGCPDEKESSGVVGMNIDSVMAAKGPYRCSQTGLCWLQANAPILCQDLPTAFAAAIYNALHDQAKLKTGGNEEGKAKVALAAEEWVYVSGRLQLGHADSSLPAVGGVANPQFHFYTQVRNFQDTLKVFCRKAARHCGHDKCCPPANPHFYPVYGEVTLVGLSSINDLLRAEWLDESIHGDTDLTWKETNQLLPETSLVRSSSL